MSMFSEPGLLTASGQADQHLNAAARKTSQALDPHFDEWIRSASRCALSEAAGHKYVLQLIDLSLDTGASLDQAAELTQVLEDGDQRSAVEIASFMILVRQAFLGVA
ncbi:hypothetical protein RRG08_021285 [Elysia crispata]|uniref:Uncharacterized protein n=1 Tax=Elysia crispata TaxID=231223 RepID=A0AAE0ZB09_9GAST|nr:hypothetical protein RRG08_021285 [Elysia crispata]